MEGIAEGRISQGGLIDAPFLCDPSEVEPAKGSAMPVAKVLVVDADKQVRALVQQTLTREGYEVIEAEDSEKGLHAVHAGKSSKAGSGVDVILCHHQASALNGVEPIECFLSLRPAVPDVMRADHPDLHCATQMFRRGVVDYLVKPLQPQIVVEVVKKAIALHRSQS